MQLRDLGLQPAGDDGRYYQPFSGAYRNLLAVVEGSDPVLRDEYILLGAHYDHVGYGNPNNSFGPFGMIHNGADDNASGVATMLEIAEAMTQLNPAPKRSVLIAFWDAEESGMNGSEHWVNNPTVPRSKVKFAFNADMLGRMREGRLYVYGSRTGWGLRKLISEQTEGSDLWVDFTWELKPNSDHWSFLSHDIPVLMFHTGLHENYHRPSDDANLINAAGMREAARVLFRSAYALAEADSITAFRSQGERDTESGHRNLERPLASLPPRFGVTWDPDAPPSEEGVAIRSVFAGSAADRAGLKSNERIVSFGGYATPDGETLRRVVALLPRDSIELIVRPADGGEPQPRTIELDGSPSRIGLAWRSDDAEPGVVILTRVVPGSPAQQAGLAVADRVYQINGQAAQEEFGFRDQLLGAVDQPIELVVERRGQLQRIVIDASLPARAEN